MPNYGPLTILTIPVAIYERGSILQRKYCLIFSTVFWVSLGYHLLQKFGWRVNASFRIWIINQADAQFYMLVQLVHLLMECGTLPQCKKNICRVYLQLSSKENLLNLASVMLLLYATHMNLVEISDRFRLVISMPLVTISSFFIV